MKPHDIKKRIIYTKSQIEKYAEIVYDQNSITKTKRNLSAYIDLAYNNLSYIDISEKYSISMPTASHAIKQGYKFVFSVHTKHKMQELGFIAII